ncbi:MAG: TauD/TfdA family dioxygenase, partial [Pseudomonadota bacterium]
LAEAFRDHAVLVIRGQDITPADHLAFARRLGPINVNRFFTPVPDHPEIAQVLKEPDQATAIGENWHTDHSYDAAPAMCSILHAIEVPPFGGDTCFASMYAAYNALSDRFKGLLDGLTARHSSRHAFGASTTDHEQYRTGRLQNAAHAIQDAHHPVVIKHPLSGRRALYVNPDFTTEIMGLEPNESDALLGFLYRHCERADFQCRVTWRAGDVTLWDNRATWHKAINDYAGHRRYMHRVTVEGVPLSA